MSYAPEPNSQGEFGFVFHLSFWICHLTLRPVVRARVYSFSATETREITEILDVLCVLRCPL